MSYFFPTLHSLQHPLWYNPGMSPVRNLNTLWWLLIPALILMVLLAPRFLFYQRSQTRIFPVEDLLPPSTAVIFGAGLTRSGNPTSVLADRIQTGVDLYRSGTVTTLMMSGSVHPPDYDEPAAMRDYAIRQGVPASAILLDREGTRTFQTCLQMQEEYGLDRVLLVTQRYHLPRALAICEGIGLEAYGVPADRRDYRALTFWNLREIPAAWVALFDLHSLSGNIYAD